MSYCSKISATDVCEMNEQKLESILDQCERICDRYYLCDTVTLMEDELKVKHEDLLKCPHCKSILDYGDCPDLFASEEEELLIKQENLLHEMWKAGYNVVTCGNCGQVFIHKT